MQLLADAHDTPDRPKSMPPDTADVASIFQVLPFHFTVSATDLPAASIDEPTAMQNLGPRQETPASLPFGTLAAVTSK